MEALMANDRALAPAVQATMRFTLPGEPNPTVYLVDYDQSTMKLEDREVTIYNAWASEEEFELEKHGFCLKPYRTALRDVLDKDAVKAIFRPEAEAFLKAVTGASRVVMFNSLARDMRLKANDDNLGAGLNVHVDHDRATYEHYMRLELGEEAEEWLSRRWAAYNIWKPLRTVEMYPLAVGDARKIQASDLVLTAVGTRPGEPLLPRTGLGVIYNPEQRWYYFPLMTADETLILKMWDTDASRPQWAAHSAFEDPTTEPDAEPRVSMDARFIAFF